MKKLFKTTLCLMVGFAFNAFPVFAEEMSDHKLQQELKTTEESKQHYHSVKGLSDRIKKVEEKVEGKFSPDNIFRNISIGGLLEVAAHHESMDFKNPASTDTDSGDIALATVELGIDAYITKHVSGHVLLLWEEDDTEPVDLDEGYISLNGEDVVPLYLDAGKMYVPFGSFESHFISDPFTLEIGETRESAVRIGFANEMFDINVSFFNGDINELTGDDKVETLVGSAVFTLPEGAVSDFELSLGVSYISNIADSDGLEGEVIAGSVNDYVAGMGFFISASIMERLFMEFEYLGATDSFAAGELSFDNGMLFQPRAYNLELAWAFNDALELGIKYEGSDDLGDLLPEKQYGCVINYGIFKNTSLGIEYLHGEYENDDERDLVTFQMAVEF